MPEEFVVEMWCDWIVAGRLQGNDTEKWIEDHLPDMVLHPKTKISIADKLVSLIYCERFVERYKKRRR